MTFTVSPFLSLAITSAPSDGVERTFDCAATTCAVASAGSTVALPGRMTKYAISTTMTNTAAPPPISSLTRLSEEPGAGAWGGRTGGGSVRGGAASGGRAAAARGGGTRGIVGGCGGAGATGGCVACFGRGPGSPG